MEKRNRARFDPRGGIFSAEWCRQPYMYYKKKDPPLFFNSFVNKYVEDALLQLKTVREIFIVHQELTVQFPLPPF